MAKGSKEMIVKVKQKLRRRKWSEKIKEQTGKDPLVCPKCECYYEYKGEVCLKEGQLVIKNAVCKTSYLVLERMIKELNGHKQEKVHEEKEASAAKPEQSLTKQRVDQLYLFAV
jgi:hypothetical protein